MLINLAENLKLMRLIYLIALLTFVAFVSAYASANVRMSEIALFAFWLLFAALVIMLARNIFFQKG